MAQRSASAGEAAIKQSLHLPKTHLPIRAGGFQRESRHVERLTSGLYRRQLTWANRDKLFALHDGPPYANGSLHMGHFMNKVLKDIANRHHLMSGNRVLFVPGWDCHGLPIELKALQEARAARKSNPGAGSEAPLSPLEIRGLARAVAEGAIKDQAADFVRWGVLGDWDLSAEARQQRGNVYVTMDPAYEAAQLRVFKALVARGAVSRALRPVHWSPSSMTALAEAELEYVDNHVSTAVYVGFPYHSADSAADPAVSKVLQSLAGGVHAVVWTTTPWTLPANVALAVHPELTYVIAKVVAKADGNTAVLSGISHVLVAESRLDELAGRLGSSPAAGAAGPGSGDTLQPVATVTGAQLAGCTFRHPLQEQGLTSVPELLAGASGSSVGVRTSRVIVGTHVTADSGTGLVHTAPGHGHDDFHACKDYNEQAASSGGTPLPVLCPVDNHGKFTGAAAPSLVGKAVLGEGNAACLGMLAQSGCLLAQHSYSHRYPYDWRSKKPIIIRTTDQWFVDVASIITNCQDTLEQVWMVPDVSRNRLKATLGGRTAWCISRQRSWGVPIPAFFRSDTGEALLTPEVVEHVARLVEQKGTDVWWSAPLEELLPPHVLEAAKAGGYSYFKGNDTLDVWFDSGSSWAAAWATNPHARELEARARRDAASDNSQATGHGIQMGLGWPADMVLEGSDQHRGWFQSSILTAVAATGQAPYKAVVSHGFVMAEDGRKMSKSLGNVIVPGDIIDGKGKGGAGSGAASGAKGKAGKGGAAGAAPAQAQSGGGSTGHGVDVLRYWVASSDYTRDVVVGSGVIGRISETLKKVRNTQRFLLGALDGYHPGRAYQALGGSGKANNEDSELQLLSAWKTGISPSVTGNRASSLRILDRGLLHKLWHFEKTVRNSYDAMALEDVVYAIAGFAARDLSPNYVELIKDRLYQTSYNWDQVKPLVPGQDSTVAKALPDRFLLQTILWETLRVSLRALAPIAPYAAEDVYQHSAALVLPEERLQALAKEQGVELGDAIFERSSTVFDSTWQALPSGWHDSEAGYAWDGLFALRAEVNKALEAARAGKDIGQASEASVEVQVESGGSLHGLLRLAEASGQLEDLLGSSSVQVMDVAGGVALDAGRSEAMRQTVVEGQDAASQAGDSSGRAIIRRESHRVSGSGGQTVEWEYVADRTVELPERPAPGGAAAASSQSAKAALTGPPVTPSEPMKVLVRSARGCKCSRCRKIKPGVGAGPGSLCGRCATVMAEQGLL